MRNSHSNYVDDFVPNVLPGLSNADKQQFDAALQSDPAQPSQPSQPPGGLLLTVYDQELPFR